jgi:hypothetical protein
LYGLNGRYIERAQVNGNTLGTCFSTIIGRTASICGVPPLLIARKMLSHQLVHSLHGLGDEILHVFDDEADLAAVNAAFFVDVIERSCGSISRHCCLGRR